MAPETTTERGRRYEELALEHLLRQGLELLERNYRCRGGEIDLVMMDGATLALVEVRMRSRAGFGNAADSVDGRKQRRVVHAAKHLLLIRPALRVPPLRFDVVAIDHDAAAGRTSVEWIKDAFRTRG